MTSRQLLTLARTRMDIPHARIRRREDLAWEGYVIDFGGDNVRSVEVDGESRREVEAMLVGALRAMARRKK